MNLTRRLLTLVLILAIFLPLGVGHAESQVEIEFFTHKATEVGDLFDQMIASFEAANPNIKVNLTQVPDARTVLYSRMASGDLPDVVGVFPNESDYRLQVASGYYMDITGDRVLANVNPSLLTNIKVDDKDYSVPLTMNAWGIFYNKSKFAELGIEPPATWDELTAVCAAIKEQGLIPLATSLKEGWVSGHLAEALVLNIAGIDGANAYFLDPSIKSADSEVANTLVDRLNFILGNSQEDAMGTDYNTAVALFTNGEALMLPQGIWALAMFGQAGMTDEVGMFPMPGDDGQGKILYGIDMALSIAADTPNAEAAKDFVAYMASTEAAQFFADNEKSPSTIIGVTSAATETEGVTKLLFEEGRNTPWLHFQWAPGVDGQWGAEVASYGVLLDEDLFFQNLDTLFGK